MLHSTWRRWAVRPTCQAAAPHRRGARAKPGVEVLEDRTLLSPATFSYDYATDPLGRVIRVNFGQDLNVSAPWDRFRFDVNATRPLMRDGSAFVADLNGDGVADLVVSDFNGAVTLYPGLPGKPSSFGQGSYVRFATSAPTDDPYYSANAALWDAGDVGDLRGDGSKEVVIGRHVYSLGGTPSQPRLQEVYTFSSAVVGTYDTAPAVGDLNGDGKPDVVLVSNYTASAYVCWNTSSDGTISFSAPQVLCTWIKDASWQHAPQSNHVALGDLNGDGLLDLAGPAGIYYNTGSATSPSFSAAALTPWNKTGGPDWLANSDQPPRVYLKDANGDGLLDVYFSNPSSTLDQVVYYQNTGTRQAPVFQYQGPVTVAGTPADLYYFGQTSPSISGNRATITTADLDGNNQPDLVASGWGFSTVTKTTWGVLGAGGRTEFAFQDTYTYPDLAKVSNPPSDAPLKPPALVGAWVDANGDGLPDLFGFADTSFSGQAGLQLYTRSGTMPFSLSAGVAVKTTSGAPVNVAGVVLVDVDKDGHPDLVTGAPNGQLLYYRNTATNGTFAFADPLPLTDASGTPISAGQDSWPTGIDLNGDGNLDFLVGGQDGKIRKVICQTPGSRSGYVLSGLVSTPEQTPLNVTHVVGGGDLAPALATIDVDHDGKMDVVMGDGLGRVWLLHNVGTGGTASFALEPLEITRTAAADLEVVSSRSIRLYFAVPVAADAVISYHDVPAGTGPVSGTAGYVLTAAVGPVIPGRRSSAVSSLSLTFSEAVSGFDLADLRLTRNGSAVSLAAATLTSSDKVTWTLGNLAGLTASDGAYALTLTASGSGIQDSAGNPLMSDAGTAWVMDTTAPTVTGAVVNGNSGALAGAQRSMVNGIAYTFSHAVTPAAGAFSIALHANVTVNGVTGQTVGTLPTLNWASLDGGVTWVVTFSGAGVVGGSIADGVYDLTLHAAAVTDTAGHALSADRVDTFYRLFGDADGNRKVNNADLAVLSAAFSRRSTQAGYLAYLDYDGSGVINNGDLAQFSARFNISFGGF